jgi:hypothetical protein
MVDQPIEYRLATACGRAATFAFLPIALLTGYLSTRAFVTNGVTFIVVDPLTIVGVCLTLILALITLSWWAECGHGWADRFRLFTGCAPLFFLLWRLDPLGLTPMAM